MKKFIITVDTEGDNQWTWKPGIPITTENARYVDKFQRLCERYGFLPVYLTNYEMIMDDDFSTYLAMKSGENKCEIGMHIHAWNSPPDFELVNKFGGNPYITEYPENVMYEKLDYLKRLIKEKTGVTPVSFRSGRWATNDLLFSQLHDLGFLVDCSITPGITNFSDKGMTVEHGNDYVKEELKVHRICENLIEVPMTTKRIKMFKGTSLKNRAKNMLLGKEIWLRPAVNTFEEMRALCEIVKSDNVPYLEFMVHSSELMPGGSPYTKTAEATEEFYHRMEQLFDYIAARDYHGITLANFYRCVVGDL